MRPETEPALRLEMRGKETPALNQLLRQAMNGIRAGAIRKQVEQEIWLLTWDQNREALRRLGAKALKGPFEVVYIRRGRGQLDLDNLSASAKCVFDALVNNGVLENDNPRVLRRWAYLDQERVAPADVGYLLELHPITD